MAKKKEIQDSPDGFLVTAAKTIGAAAGIPVAVTGKTSEVWSVEEDMFHVVLLGVSTLSSCPYEQRVASTYSTMTQDFDSGSLYRILGKNVVSYPISTPKLVWKPFQAALQSNN